MVTVFGFSFGYGFKKLDFWTFGEKKIFFYEKIFFDKKVEKLTKMEKKLKKGQKTIIKTVIFSVQVWVFSGYRFLVFFGLFGSG